MRIMELRLVFGSTVFCWRRC